MPLTTSSNLVVGMIIGHLNLLDRPIASVPDAGDVDAHLPCLTIWTC